MFEDRIFASRIDVVTSEGNWHYGKCSAPLVEAGDINNYFSVIKAIIYSGEPSFIGNCGLLKIIAEDTEIAELSFSMDNSRSIYYIDSLILEPKTSIVCKLSTKYEGQCSVVLVLHEYIEECIKPSKLGWTYEKDY